MQLRNAVLIALAFDATQQEIDQAHELIDRLAGGVDPSALVAATATATANSEPVTVETTEPVQPAAAPALDKDGLPWDERIHAGTKALNADGTWRGRRGIDAGLKSKVEAELRATIGSAPVQQAAAPAPVPAPPTPPLPGGNLPPVPGAAAVNPAYAALVQFIAANTESATNPAGKFTDDYIRQVLSHYGVAEGSLQNLAHRPDLLPEIDTWLKSVIAG